MSSTASNNDRQQQPAHVAQRTVRMGRYGTACFKGAGERFARPKQTPSTNVEPYNIPGLAEAVQRDKHKGSIGLDKSPRFTSPRPVLNAQSEGSYSPRGMADLGRKDKQHGSAAFKMSEPRFRERSSSAHSRTSTASREHSAINTSAGALSQAADSARGRSAERARSPNNNSSRPSAAFKSPERFRSPNSSRGSKSPSAHREPILLPGMAEEIQRSKHGVINRSKSPRFAPDAKQRSAAIAPAPYNTHDSIADVVARSKNKGPMTVSSSREHHTPERMQKRDQQQQEKNKGKVGIHESYSPPGIASEILKSKSGTLAFRQTSLGHDDSSSIANNSFHSPAKKSGDPILSREPIVLPGMAEEVAKTPRGKFSSKGSPRFHDAAAPRNPAKDIAPYDIPGFAELCVHENKCLTDGRVSRASRAAFKATSPRFKEAKHDVCDKFYEQSSFVDEILKK